MSKPEPDKSYYSILGADECASQEEIERYYKRLALAHHPDRGGDEDEMKSINEAYGVLGQPESRATYDERQAQRRVEVYRAYTPTTSPAATMDALGGRLAGALLCLLLGLSLLFLVRAQYVIFLWPLGLLAVGIVLLGIWMAHAALSLIREGKAATHPLRRFAWAQEVAFWTCVCGGVYGVYEALTLI